MLVDERERDNNTDKAPQIYTIAAYNCSEGYSTRFVSVGLSVFSVHLSVLCDMYYNLEILYIKTFATKKFRELCGF